VNRAKAHSLPETYDVAVIGAGVFGSWAAYRLALAGKSVVLLDAYGPAHSRASSGGESRIIRMGYGPQEIYTRWSMRSLELWLEFCDIINDASLFHRTGVLWTAPERDPYTQATRDVLTRCGTKFESLSASDLTARFPQFRFGHVTEGILEPDSGALMARRAVQSLVREAVRRGVKYVHDGVESPTQSESLHTISGERIKAEAYVFACGAWLPKLFPDVLGQTIRPTRQEVFFFGLNPGDSRFHSPEMPVWIDFSDERRPYTLPALEGRGFKLAFDTPGSEFDPDRGSRLLSPDGIVAAHAFIGKHLPSLAGAPLIESRVCQYELTPNRDFIIDRHPAYGNVWLVGGGSGHGFKHGPALGEHVANLVQGLATPEPQFRLSGSV